MLPNGQLIVDKISDVGCSMYWIVESVISDVHTEGYGDRDSSVGIATGYGLDGPGIESR
jgi:hypothetical protein